MTLATFNNATHRSGETNKTYCGIRPKFC